MLLLLVTCKTPTAEMAPISDASATPTIVWARS